MINYKNPKIIINEDDTAYCRLVEKTLKSAGFKNIKTYYSGEECINNINTDKPDIIIQDFAMPGLDGIEVMKKVKSISPVTEFIFLSGQTSIKVAVETIKQGAFDYIIKDEVMQQNVIQKINRILYIHKLKFQKRTLAYGQWLFLAVLIISWGVIALLWYLGIFR